VNTGRRIEARYGLRLSLHLFRCGFHWKLRRGDRFGHFAAKFQRGSSFGRKHGRRHLWIGWWETKAGQRGALHGRRFGFYSDKLPVKPTAGMRIPFFPQPERQAARRARRMRSEEEV
jgi:hypothetical protein